MNTLAQYKLETGYYDEQAIMRDGGMGDRDAAFSDIFGDSVTELAPAFQALLDAARAHNTAMYQAAKRIHDERISTILRKPAFTAEEWRVLVRAGYAHVDGDDDSSRYVLNQDAPHLVYADQAGIDG